MKNKDNTIYKVYIIENVTILILAGFLCYIFKSLWGLLPLVCLNTGVKTRSNDDEE